MTIKIKTAEIGVKGPVEVKPTIDNQGLANNILITLMQSDLDATTESLAEDSSEKPEEVKDEDLTEEELKARNKKRKEESIETTKKAIQDIQEEEELGVQIFEFLKTVLKLTDAQVTAARKKLSFEELGEYVYYVIGRLKGKSDADFELEKKVEEAKKQDPKKE